MEARIDPRGNLPASIIRPLPYFPRPRSSLLDFDLRRSTPNTLQKPRKNQCFDWIFSSSSNVHVAIDRAAFMTYNPFESYALTLSDQSRVNVLGVGTVELRIRCKPGSRSHRTIFLENVLHIPDWICNVFSDVYFHSLKGFDFSWDEFGVSFVAVEGDKLKPHGYTENFRGLDRLVLARKQEGRSPMTEDKEREVFAINITWPQSQINKWDEWVMVQTQRRFKQIKERRKTDESRQFTNQMNCSPKSESRMHLGVINGNVNLTKKRRGGSMGNLRASLSAMSLSSFAKRMT